MRVFLDKTTQFDIELAGMRTGLLGWNVQCQLIEENINITRRSSDGGFYVGWKDNSIALIALVKGLGSVGFSTYH